MTAAPALRRSPARRRILDTATALFYGEGIRAVGVDRIIAEAGVAKATFYHHFPAKDDLVVAYVQEQSRLQREAVERLPRAEPVETILAVFDAIGEIACGPGFRGCVFLNAAAEYPDPDHPVRRAVEDYRRWFRTLLTRLLEAAGHPDPARTAAILLALRDGLVVGGHLDDPHHIRTLTRDSVTRVLQFA
ncbi:TetR/AcrR family transcriptional regulator [Thermomonospora cellulosilytica]|uniref:AcrR family transcriptional regulator n=1 Tax=Thermomonospora cellulosilytica TaxID=1411118 RepID=A0A7W3MYZ7_9ACTN|nr:TetR/AcrR family transcriptional regulator [Thermomonospora cellulosilytica]MBA9004489.1 AcrR family transcriptional regulator [Thermomonospora cellulosilytica]